MKKLLFIFAALCCMVFTAKADTFSDGASVYVGTIEMSDALLSLSSANEGSHITSGTVSYDATTHTLTLNNVTIEGTHSNRELYLWVGTSTDFDFTVKLIGTNVINASSRGIWAYIINKSHKFIITGDKDASLEVNTTSTSVPALTFSRSNGSSVPDDEYYHNLEIKGGCSISLKSAWDGALECYHFVLDSCNLVAESVNGVLVVKGGAEFKNVEKMESTISKVDYRVPSEFYPVYFQGHHLNSLKHEFNAVDDWGYLDDGTFSYDDATRTLTLDGAEKTTGTLAMIKIKDDSGSSDPVNIVLKNTSSLGTTAGTGIGMDLYSPVVIKGNGVAGQKLIINSSYNDAIVLNPGASLTLETYAEVSATGGKHGVHGIEADGVYPTVTLKASNLKAYGGSVASFDGVDLSIPETDVIISQPTSAVYNESTHQVEKGSVVMGDDVLFSKTVSFVSAGIEVGEGSVSILRGDAVLELPVRLDGAEELTFKAVPAEGYVFKMWVDALGTPVSYLETDNYNCGTDVLLKAVFYKKVPSDAQWIAITSSTFTFPCQIYKLKDNLTEAEQYATTKKFPDVTDLTNLVIIKEDEGKQQVLYTDVTTGPKVALVTNQFDPANDKVSGASAIYVRNPQDTYDQVSAMAYSLHEDKIYMVAHKKADGKWYLLVNDMSSDDPTDPIGDEIKELNLSGNPITALAVSPEGQLFGVGHSLSDNNFYLFEINKTTGALTPLVDLVDTYDSNYRLQSLAFDIVTNTLVWSYQKVLDNTTFIEIQLADGATPAALYTLGAMEGTLAALFQWVPDHAKVTLSVKAGHEEGGKVALAGGGTSGTYYIGAKVPIKAKVEEGHKFARWTDGTDEKSTKAIDTLVIENNININRVAEFAWADGVTPYTIWIGGKQMHSQRLIMTSENNPAISNTNSSVRYNPDTKVLTFTAPIIYYDGGAIIIGSEEEGLDLTINVRNASTISEYTENGIKIIKSKVTIKGVDKISVGAGKSAVLLDRSELTLEGLEHVSWFNGTGAGIKGVTGDEKLTILGCNMKITSTNVSVDNLAECKWNYCTIDPSTAVFEEKKMKDAAGGATSTSLEFTPWPKLTVTPVVDGTGSFTLKSSDSEFTNTGWFQSGVEVTITPNPADGYAFGYWVDDPKWNDEDESQRIAEERKITKSAGSEAKEARFFYVPKSSSTWYGVNNNKFVSFSLSDHGLVVAKASSPSASSVKAGDYTTSGWVYQDGSTVKLKDFSGIEDGEEMAGDVTDLGTSATSAKDIAFNFTDKKTYAVDGTKLYSVDEEGKFEEIGAFEFEDAPAANIVSIAINGKGDMYVLQAGLDGRLFSIDEMDEEGKKVKLAKVGDSGFTGINVTNEAQSLAFDHITGELFLGADDAIHIISTEDAKAHIVASLGCH